MSNAAHFHRAARALLGLQIALASVLFTTTPALAAGNTTNRWYSFWFSGTYATQGAEWQPKDADSVCFLEIKDLDMNRVNFYIDGSTSNDGHATNRTRGEVATAYYKGYFVIHNYVHENGESWARLTAMSPDGFGFVKGYWSPDSNEPWHTSLN
ncbi:MAG: hypothetical protein LKI67_08345 [Olsenella sp.]|jgi:hypothetical protein|nr:hypothetical protein [Olsenella sp.]MCI1644675.1 hypothetical protein [Olsenella sp.]MCI1793144.1 hypothetical protein [Olsenella sp.]MCI1811849.1 hypothetical protein [Olsenella sp.]